MNNFTADGVRFLNRASGFIDALREWHDLADAVVYYSFGIERLAKGVLYDINPLFVLEKPDFEVAVQLLYLDRLVTKRRKGAEAEAKKRKNSDIHVHAFAAAITNAAQFSQTLLDHMGALHQLNEYRGIVAHRTCHDLPSEEVRRFMEKTFCPVVTAFAAEHKLEVAGFFASAGIQNKLCYLSSEIKREEDTEKSITELKSKHKAAWDQKKRNPESAERAAFKTNEELRANVAEAGTRWTTCPACGNAAVLYLALDWEPGDGGAEISGVYVDRLHCFYCDLSLRGYEQIDHLELNRLLYEGRLEAADTDERGSSE